MAAKKTAAKKGGAAKKSAGKSGGPKKKPIPNYICTLGIPTGPCAVANLPTNVPQLAAELEAYFKCLCMWQVAVTDEVNRCCGAGGPGNVPPPPPPPF
jgi:hypothetical protein